MNFLNDGYFANKVGIGDSTPNSKLKVTGGTSETSIYTVDINHVRNDANVATHAMRLNVDLSGADTTTADRTNSGLFLDIDSSANGDASNEHRIRGVNSDVRFSGFTDSAQGGYFLVESNYLLGKTAQLIGVYGVAVHDTSSTDGGVSNMYGVFGTSSIQDLGDVDNAFGGFFSVDISSARGNANVGVTKGVEGHIDINKAATITYGEMMAVSGIIDNNEGTVPTFGNQYLFKGDYQGTKGGNAYGIYCEGDKHYFDGNVGIGTTSPIGKLNIQQSTLDIPFLFSGRHDSENEPILQMGESTEFSGSASYGELLIHSYNRDIVFSTQSEATFSNVDAAVMIIEKTNGNVGIGTTSPSEKLDVAGNIKIQAALFSNQENTDVDTGAEVVAQVAIATYTAAFFDFVIKKTTNVRSGTVYACHDGTNVEFTETSTNDLGDTSDVTLSVDISGTNMRLLATVTSDDWSVKSLIRAI